MEPARTATVRRENGDIIVRHLRITQTHWQKFRGLMFDDSLKPEEGLLITNCNAIHCCFMKIAIDVIFLSQSGHIIRLLPEMKPWSFSPVVREAVDVLELYPGAVERHALRVGERLFVRSS